MNELFTVNSMIVTEAIGLVAGFIAISTAIYLQMIMKEPCPVRYVTGFFLFGLIMIVLNSSLVISHSSIIMGLQILTYTLVIAGELYMANEIKKKVRERSSIETFDGVFARYL